MFVDEKKAGEAQTKADPFTLESLIAWLEKQPPEKRYDYECNGSCLLAQYFIAAGYENVVVGGSFFSRGDGFDCEKLPADFNDIALGKWGRFHSISTERTFGGALKRARFVQAK